MEYYSKLTELMRLTYFDSSSDNQLQEETNNTPNTHNNEYTFNNSIETLSVIMDLLYIFDINKIDTNNPYHTCWSVGNNKNGQQAINYNIINNKKLRIMNKLPNNIYVNDIIIGCWGSTYILYSNTYNDDDNNTSIDNKLIVFGCNASGQLSIDQDQITKQILSYWCILNGVTLTESIIKLIINKTNSLCHNFQEPLIRSLMTPLSTTFDSFDSFNNHKISFISSGIPSHHKFIVTQDTLTLKDHLFGVGRNNHNQLGAADRKNRHQLTEIKYFQNISTEIAQIHCARDYTHFLTEKGELFESSERSIAIKPIKMKATIIDLCCGYEHTLAINHNRGIYSWGDNFYGQLGHGQHKSRVAEPKMIRSLNRSKVYANLISAGQHHSAIVSTYGQVHVFGWNEFYQCGDGTDQNIFIPKLNEILIDIDIKDIKCGFNHNVAVTNDDQYYFWGHNRYNQCMVFDDNVKYVTVPTKWEYINDIGKFRKILNVYPGWCSTIVVTT